jgi:hypothetical protein
MDVTNSMILPRIGLKYDAISHFSQGLCIPTLSETDFRIIALQINLSPFAIKLAWSVL